MRRKQSGQHKTTCPIHTRRGIKMVESVSFPRDYALNPQSHITSGCVSFPFFRVETRGSLSLRNALKLCFQWHLSAANDSLKGSWARQIRGLWLGRETGSVWWWIGALSQCRHIYNSNITFEEGFLPLDRYGECHLHDANERPLIRVKRTLK